MDRLGPFEPNPALAVAVSGGADSMALALLAHAWACRHGGSVQALVVDHRLRAASHDEARATIDRLAHLGIASRILGITDLPLGSALAERARIMRYQALTNACSAVGILHLLLGHHAADQVETLAMRVLRGSQTHGLAGMPALRETAAVRLLRPLLGIEPMSLRRFLTAHRVGWIEDPSNQDLHALRPRLRQTLASVSPHETGLTGALTAVGRRRQQDEQDIAVELARCATIRPEGFALLSSGRITAGALSALIQAIAGAAYPASPRRVAELAARLRPATVAGVRLLTAGRFGDGMLIVREEAAIGPKVSAQDGAVWDGRYRLIARHGAPARATIAQLGADAERFRRLSDLPSVVLRTLPAVRIGDVLASVPHLGYVDPDIEVAAMLRFDPRKPAAGSAFVPAA
ncbi:MAG TPA: tRNA lysidine(34) synthetase TilS [Rhodopila sp.]|jgi:tRNA(Ile)-lysidine synthase